MKSVILTGDRPTGQLHLGHYIGSLKSRVELQNDYDQYIMIADIQALTDYFEHPEHVKKNVTEVIKDYIAVGINPDRSTIFIQSQIKELFELTILFLNLVTTSRLERNPTIKSEILMRGFSNSIPAGFLCYPVSQAADIVLFKATHVPAGEDQAPMIEQTNEIVRKFNRVYNTNCLNEVTLKLSKTPRLIGIDGKAKASKSLKNAIFLADSTNVLHDKVFSMYTDPDHIKISEPGKVKGNVVFEYLDAFYNDQDEIDNLKKEYQKGGLGDIYLKNLLYSTLEKLIAPIREKREQVSDNEALDVALEGTKRAQEKAKQTIEEVRDVMHIKY